MAYVVDLWKTGFTLKDVATVRVKGKKRSPLISVPVGSIAASSQVAFDLRSREDTGSYAPFNYLYVANRSQVVIRLVIDGSIVKRIAPSTIETFDAQSIPAFSVIQIFNEDTATAVNSGEVELLVQRVPLRLGDVPVGGVF